MHQSVKDVFIPFSEPLEGIVPRLYADVLGLVTTGMGNLVDPMPYALALPWELPGGIPAPKDAVVRAWTAVKNDPLCASRGWRYACGIPANNVRLSSDAVHALILDKLESNDKAMLVRFPDWESRPADAQLAAHSMAWAMGPGFWHKFPRFTVAFKAGDYRVAAKESAISPASGTVIERNARNHALLINADDHTGDPSVLDWQLPTT